MKHTYFTKKHLKISTLDYCAPGYDSTPACEKNDELVWPNYCNAAGVKNKVILGVLLVLVFCLLNPFHSVAQIVYSGDTVITKGGTYVGNWESRDSNKPAVTILTHEPVIIENSNIRGAGFLIQAIGSTTHPVNVTVRHTNGYGLPPTDYSGTIKERRFLAAEIFSNVVVENCYMEGTAGIYIANEYRGNGTPSETVKIRYNKAKNIDGRIHGGTHAVQFVQFNFRGNLPHAEIAWNEVINEPNNSLVEDNINIHNSRGTAASPIKIHNNYIQGSYPIPANGTEYTGGGIIADGDGDLNTCPKYIHADNNQLVNQGNYSMGIAAGNNIQYTNNRSVSSSLFEDGSPFNMYSSGMWSKDLSGNNTVFNNIFDSNTIGVMNRQYNDKFPSVRNDFTDTINVTITRTKHLPYDIPITKETEREEFVRWQQKLADNNIKLGPVAPDSDPDPNPGPVTGTGKITREYWANVTTDRIGDIPVNSPPTSTSELTVFEAPANVGDHYGQRVRGYITAPATGQYTFWIASDNHGELWLSTSEDTASKRMIAYVNGWTNPREWGKYGTQQSAPVMLEAGQRYYIEALHVESGGGDHLAVGWQMPDGKQERPIAGKRLSPVT